MKELLIVWHSRTGAARQLAQAIERGALQTAAELGHDDDFRIRWFQAHEARAADLLAADGYAFCAPENLASLSGEMKEFFDRAFYEVEDKLAGRPYGIAISAGTDGAGAARQVERICTGWRLRLLAPALIVRNGAQTAEQIWAAKTVAEEALGSARELGGLLAATLLMGV